MPSVHSKSPEALASGTDSNIIWLRCTTCVGHLGWLFKLNLHPRHQHCTDEAQKAETVLSAVSSQLINILGSLSSFWPERDQKMAGLASKVVFCPDWVSTYENNGLTSCKRTPSGLGVSGGAVGLWKVC